MAAVHPISQSQHSMLPLEPILLAQQNEDKNDSALYVEVAFVDGNDIMSTENPISEAGSAVTIPVSMGSDVLQNFEDCNEDETTDSRSDEVMFSTSDEHEILVSNYTFFSSMQLGQSQLLRGICRPIFGRCARRVTALAICNVDLQDFVKEEGAVWRVLHNRPHPGFPPLRQAVEGERHGCTTSFLVMDDLDIDLLSHVRARERLAESEAKGIFRQILSAVTHAHKNRIFLNDLKLDKIFFTDKSRTNVVIADLQGAVVVPKSHRNDAAERQDYFFVGLGSLLYTMITGADPYHDATCLHTKMVGSKVRFTFPDYVSGEAQDFIQSFLGEVLDLDDNVVISQSQMQDLLEDALDNDWLSCREGSRASAERDSLANSMYLNSTIGSHLTYLSDSFSSTGSGYNPFSGFDGTRSVAGSRRQSICVEVDTDQVVPDSCTLESETQPSFKSNEENGLSYSAISRNMSTRENSESQSERNIVDEPTLSSQRRRWVQLMSPQREFTHESSHIDASSVPRPPQEDGTVIRHRVYVNRKLRRYRRRHHPY